MNIQYGSGKTRFGPGVQIDMDGDELADAIDLWLTAQGVLICGPRTITANGDLCRTAGVYVDPSGYARHLQTFYSGRGEVRP